MKESLSYSNLLHGIVYVFNCWKVAKEMKKNAAKRRQKKITNGVIGAVVGVLVVGVGGVVLYKTVIEDKIAETKETKIIVTDANGSEVEFTPEDLQAELNTNTFYQGISIDGVDVSGKTLDEVKAMFATTRGSTASDVVDVKFQVEDELVPLDTTGLTLTSNIDEIIEQAYNYGRTSTLEGNEGLKDRYNTVMALKTNPISFASSFTISTDTISTLTYEALNPYNKEVVEAYASGFDKESLQFIIEESQEGCSVDIEKAAADVKASLDNAEYQVVIPVDCEIIEPQTSADFLRDYLCCVSTTSSDTADKPNRNTNIRLVCETIDGLVLQPGETFDFNEVVGERTADKGYKPAPGIVGGAYKDELGGGICQANTMLYHSVVKADLQVDERKNHTYPSSYVPYGTDATVTWKSPNFRFTNNTDYPIAIHAYYSNLKVTVSIYGRPLDDGMRIELIGEQLSSTPPTGTVYIADPTMAVGTTKTEKDAHTGYRYTSWKVYYDKDGNEIKREEYFQSTYSMSNKEVRVGTLGPDGTIYIMDPATGKVSPPGGVTPTPDPNAPTPDPSNPTPDPSNPTPEPTTPTPEPTTPTPEPTTPTPEPQPTDPTDPPAT